MRRARRSLNRAVSGHSRRFRTLLSAPRAVQERELRSVLEKNRTCRYGERWGFDSITSIEDFVRRVPVVRYEDLGASIERMIAGERDVLTAEPVVAFEETGGSSGGGKLIAYTEGSLAAFRRGLLPWLDDLFKAYPGLAEGTAYWAISPACRKPRRTPANVPIGLESDAAYFGHDIAPHILANLSIPPALGLVHDIDLWRHLTALYLLADERLSLISVWSPTFLLDLLRYARGNAAWLVNCIAEGKAGMHVPPGIASHLPIFPNPLRAEKLAAALRGCNPSLEICWPRLQVISCWDQAASKPYAQDVQRLFPDVHVQGKGLLATEGLVSIPLAGYALPVLALESGFFEFLDGTGVAKCVEELSCGDEYELLITNHSGLYRYAIGDRVRVCGFAEKTPMLEFLGRNGIVSDLFGEKLSEEFVLRALRDFQLRFALLAPDRHSRAYVLLIDAADVPANEAIALAASLDAALAANPQYAYARRLQQLGPLFAVRCLHPIESWTSLGIRRGQRLGDIKPPALFIYGDWQETFTALS